MLWAAVLTVLLSLAYGGVLYASQLLRAASVLYALAEKPTPPSVNAYNYLFGYKSAISELAIPGEKAPIALRVYTPLGRKAPPSIVVVHGLAGDGNLNNKLNKLAFFLSRQGFRVVLPTLPDESHVEMTVADRDRIASTILWSSQTGGQKVSVMGISFGGGLAIAAAEQPGVKEYVRMIFCISGYNDLDAIGRYYMHEPVYGPTGRPYPEIGPAGGAILFVKQYLNERFSAADAAALRGAIDETTLAGRFPLAANDPIVLALKPDQQKLFLDLQGVRTPAIRQYYLDVLATHHAEILAISPKSVMEHLDLPLYVIHGTDDRSVPEQEVEWMEAEAPKNNDLHVLVTPWMTHANIINMVSHAERVRVGWFFSDILTQAAKD